MIAVTPSLGEILGSCLNTVPVFNATASLDEAATMAAAFELSGQAARVLGVGDADVFEALCRIPDHMLDLLRTPDGWTALTAFAASQLGIEPPHFRPSLH